MGQRSRESANLQSIGAFLSGWFLQSRLLSLWICKKESTESFTLWKYAQLVGSFNPFEKNWSKWKSSPSRVENKRYLKHFETTIQKNTQVPK